MSSKTQQEKQDRAPRGERLGFSRFQRATWLLVGVCIHSTIFEEKQETAKSLRTSWIYITPARRDEQRLVGEWFHKLV